MNKDIRLLYSSDEIYRYFKGKEMLKIDYFDSKTMEWYVKSKLNDISVKDLKVMLNTIKNQIDTNSKVQSLGSNNLNIIISLISFFGAIFIAIYAVVVAYMLSKGYVESVQSMEQFLKIAGSIIFFYLLFIAYNFLMSLRRIYNLGKLQKILEISIRFKKNRKLNNT